MSGRLLTERRGRVGYLVFDHEARRNAVTARMWREIPGAVQRFAEDDEVRVVVMRGAGETAFIAGADISEFETARTGAAAESYDATNVHAFESLANFQKPLLAMIHGFCVGGGVALALHADMRFCSDDAKFQIPAGRLGLGYPPMGLQTLSQVVGFSNAAEIFFTAERFGAEDALRLGLVNRVLPKAGLEVAVEEIAQRISDNAPLTLRAAKVAFCQLRRPAAERDIAQVQAAVATCYASEDYQEGVAAFLEKRKARFRGV